jgi:hypothetical protein
MPPDERDRLIPSTREVAERLTIVAREHSRLRALLKLASQQEDDLARWGRVPDPLRDSPRGGQPGGGHE